MPFYCIHVSVAVGDACCRVSVGCNQSIVFREREDQRRPDVIGIDDGIYDPHFCLYLTHFTETFQRLEKLGLIWSSKRENIFQLDDALRVRQFRFRDIIHPQTGELLVRLEHEIRSVSHPYFHRVLVTRDGTAGIYCKQ